MFGDFFLGGVGHGGGFFCWDLTRSLLRSRSGGRSGALGDLKMNLNR